jgi:cysteine desulfurase/selenocysteine lyase
MSIRPATSRAPQPIEEGKSTSLDVWRIRKDFPILDERIHGQPLVYLDNANTTQKPKSVIEAVRNYYLHDNANIHRSTHLLSERATQGYEDARAKIQRFINAARPSEIIFTRNATESINLVVSSYGRRHIQAGDEIVISTMEHHSNIVPWQILCEEKGAALRVIPINDAGELLLDEYERLLNPRTKFVSIVEMSNSLGTINPIRQIIDLAHKHGIPVMVDGAQAIYHRKVDVRALDCEFYVFSGHKTYGPTGIGVLYGKASLLDEMPPYQGGGDMIRSVTFEKTLYNSVPHKFEAGTPNIAGAIGLGVAIDYLQWLGMDRIAAHEQEVLAYGTQALSEIAGLRLIGTAKRKASILSFVLEGIHPHDIGTVLDQEGVAVRTGQHCTQPVMDRYGLPATVRASLALYNTKEDIDALVRGIHRAQEVLG